MEQATGISRRALKSWFTNARARLKYGDLAATVPPEQMYDPRTS